MRLFNLFIQMNEFLINPPEQFTETAIPSKMLLCIGNKISRLLMLTSYTIVRDF